MEFKESLNKWLTRSQEIVNKHYENRGWNNQRPTLKIQNNGRKYIRIISCDPGKGSGYAFCFIDKETGNVLKPAGWGTPAKQPRGNIYQVGREGVNAYGALYLS